MPSDCHTLAAANVRPGEHVCCLYQSTDELPGLLIPFVQHGLARGEKVCCVGDAPLLRDIYERLRASMPQFDALIRERQLVMLAPEEWLPGGPCGLADWLARETELILKEGWSALRFTWEAEDILRASLDAGRPVETELTEKEASIEAAVEGARLAALCRYRYQSFSADALLRAMAVHPLIMAGGRLCENPDHIPCAALHSAEGLVQRRLANLLALEQIRNTVRQSEERYRRIVESAADAFFVHDL